MKRIIALLICALLALLPALAEDLPENPFGLFQDEYSGGTEPRENVNPDENITLDINGRSVQLSFDASPQYSSIQDGMVQASYYAYSEGSTLYELYLSFPETAKPGMVITPEYEAITNGDASVTLIISDSTREQYYFSSLANGTVYPKGSDFAISIDSIDGGTYAGTFTATLIALDMASGDAVDTLIISETPFRFTLSGVRDGIASPAPTAVPNDMRKV